MLQRLFRLLVGIGIAVTIVFVAFAHLSLREVTAIQTNRGVCISTRFDQPTCFSTSEMLSNEAPGILAVSPDGQLLASSLRNEVQLWDLQTDALVRTIDRHADRISALTFSPDSSVLASGSLDETVRLWDVGTGASMGVLPAGRTTCLAFSPDGRSLASGSRIAHWVDGYQSATGVQIWDLQTEQLRNQIGTEPIAAIAFSPNGSLLAAGSSKTQLWDVRRKTRLRTLNSGDLTSLAFSRDGDFLITASSRIKVWRVPLGRLNYAFRSKSSYLSLSPDSMTLATVNGGTVNLWELDSHRFLGTLRASWFSRATIAFALNGRALVGGGSDGIRIWRPQAVTSQPSNSVDDDAEPSDRNDRSNR